MLKSQHSLFASHNDYYSSACPMAPCISNRLAHLAVGHDPELTPRPLDQLIIDAHRWAESGRSAFWRRQYEVLDIYTRRGCTTSPCLVSTKLDWLYIYRSGRSVWRGRLTGEAYLVRCNTDAACLGVRSYSRDHYEHWS
jgi:hypothetical protein